MTLFLAAVTAVTWGFGELVYLRITKALGGYTASLWTSIFGLVLIIPVAIASGFPTSGVTDFALAMGGALVGVAGALLYALALQYGQLSIVSPVVSAAAGVSAVLAVLVLGEHLRTPTGDRRRRRDHRGGADGLGGAWRRPRAGHGARRALSAGARHLQPAARRLRRRDRADLGDRRLPHRVRVVLTPRRSGLAANSARTRRAPLARPLMRARDDRLLHPRDRTRARAGGGRRRRRLAVPGDRGDGAASCCASACARGNGSAWRSCSRPWRCSPRDRLGRDADGAQGHARVAAAQVVHLEVVGVRARRLDAEDVQQRERGRQLVGRRPRRQLPPVPRGSARPRSRCASRSRGRARDRGRGRPCRSHAARSPRAAARSRRAPPSPRGCRTGT